MVRRKIKPSKKHLKLFCKAWNDAVKQTNNSDSQPTIGIKMKKLLTIVLLFTMSICSAQKKYTGSDDKSGLVLASVGAVSMTIGVFVPDGSEWTYKSTYNSQVITKPFYMNPARDCMIVFGMTLTIGGLRYNHVNK